MHRARVTTLWVLSATAFLLICGGCTTTGGTSGPAVESIGGLSPARIGEADTDVEPRPVTDLLRDARAAFEEGNAAQEAGDQEAAFRHYRLMLELLVEAELDPSVFYSLRDEFASILSGSTEQVDLLARRGPLTPVGAEGFKPVGEYSEIQVPFPLPERVLQEIERIQNGYPENFQRGLDRSFKYLPYIRAELEQAGLPREIEMLAMIESQFHPTARSHAGAVGMWQFIPTTGRRYGLRVDDYVDERKDWQSETRAAIAYLTDLYDMFEGDWALALSAYNMGEGGLGRALASNGGEKDFWTLIETPPASNSIRLETKRYYPKFLATLIVSSNPERYGFKLNPGPAEELAHMAVDGPYVLDDLDEAMGYATGTLARMNPDLLQGMTPWTGAYTVTVPAADRHRFASALRRTNRLEYGGQTHRVRKGETVSGIAARYQVSSRELMRLNNITSPRRLRIGQDLKIPGYGRGGGGGTDGGGMSVGPGGFYTVRKGDTLYDIAKAQGVSISDLQRWNNLGKKPLQIGQKLKLSASGKPASSGGGGGTASASAPPRYHKVRSGESPWEIARNYKISLDDFLAWNNLTRRSRLRIGQQVEVSAPGASTPKFAPAAVPENAEKVYHTVAKGDTASTIAAKYGVNTSAFLSWNGLTSRSVLPVGKKYVVYRSGTAPTAAAPAPAADAERTITHTVTRGQNPTTIARRYGVKVSDLFRWNDWPKGHVLHIGDEVIIRK